VGDHLPPQDGELPLAEVCTLLFCSERTVRRLIHARRFPCPVMRRIAPNVIRPHWLEAAIRAWAERDRPSLRTPLLTPEQMLELRKRRYSDVLERE